jgi:hypothetical protein
VGEPCNYVLQDCRDGLKCVRDDDDDDGEDERIGVTVVDDPCRWGSRASATTRRARTTARR